MSSKNEQQPPSSDVANLIAPKGSSNESKLIDTKFNELAKKTLDEFEQKQYSEDFFKALDEIIKEPIAYKVHAIDLAKQRRIKSSMRRRRSSGENVRINKSSVLMTNRILQQRQPQPSSLPVDLIGSRQHSPNKRTNVINSRSNKAFLVGHDDVKTNNIQRNENENGQSTTAHGDRLVPATRGYDQQTSPKKSPNYEIDTMRSKLSSRNSGSSKHSFDFDKNNYVVYDNSNEDDFDDDEGDELDDDYDELDNDDDTLIDENQVIQSEIIRRQQIRANISSSPPNHYSRNLNPIVKSNTLSDATNISERLSKHYDKMTGVGGGGPTQQQVSGNKRTYLSPQNSGGNSGISPNQKAQDIQKQRHRFNNTVSNPIVRSNTVCNNGTSNFSRVSNRDSLPASFGDSSVVPELQQQVDHRSQQPRSMNILNSIEIGSLYKPHMNYSTNVLGNHRLSDDDEIIIIPTQSPSQISGTASSDGDTADDQAERFSISRTKSFWEKLSKGERGKTMSAGGNSGAPVAAVPLTL